MNENLKLQPLDIKGLKPDFDKIRYNNFILMDRNFVIQILISLILLFVIMVIR